MRSKITIIVVFLIAMSAGLAPMIVQAQGDESLIAITDTNAFELGNASYKDGDFQQALTYYDQALDVHGPLAEIYYNIGNTYFRLGRKGMAKVNFLRAQRLAPRRSQIDKNINYLNSLIEYRIDDESSWYLVQVRRLLGVFTTTELSVMLWSSLALLFLFLFAWIFSAGKVRSIVNILLLIQCCLVVISVGTLVVKKYVANPGLPAVVLEQGADVRYGPSIEDKVMFKLVEGLELYVVDRRTAWSRITLLNKETGWVQNDSIEMV